MHLGWVLIWNQEGAQKFTPAWISSQNFLDGRRVETYFWKKALAKVTHLDQTRLPVSSSASPGGISLEMIARLICTGQLQPTKLKLMQRLPWNMGSASLETDFLMLCLPWGSGKVIAGMGRFPYSSWQLAPINDPLKKALYPSHFSPDQSLFIP